MKKRYLLAAASLAVVLAACGSSDTGGSSNRGSYEEEQKDNEKEDVKEEADGMEIITDAAKLMEVRENLIQAGIKVTSAELKYLANNTIELDGGDLEKAEKLLDAIDDMDDVVAVHTNLG